MTDYATRSRMIDTARIDEIRQRRVRLTREAAPVDCSTCGVQHWRPDLLAECVGCQLRRVMARRQA